MSVATSGQYDALGQQEINQSHQGQADKAVGVATLKALKQGDAQGFGLEAAGAAIGLVGEQVALNLLSAEMPEADFKGFGDNLTSPGAGIEQAESGLKQDGFARQVFELMPGTLMIAGLAECFIPEGQYLIRANDQAVRVGIGKGPGLGLAEPEHQAFGVFTGEGGFVNIRAGNRKRQSKLFQQGPAGGRGRGQQEWQGWLWHGEESRSPKSRENTMVFLLTATSRVRIIARLC